MCFLINIKIHFKIILLLKFILYLKNIKIYLFYNKKNIIIYKKII